MKHTATIMTLLLGTLCLPKAHAVTVLECVDEAGNSTYQDHCPPGTTPANKRDIKTGTSEAATAPAAPGKKEATPSGGDIIFYTTSTECDACLVIKATLTKYGASFTEKDISTDMAVRQELKDKTGASSSVSVPTVIIGDQIISGFNKEALSKALENAVYSKPEPAPAAPAPTAPGQAAAPAPTTVQPEENRE